MHDEHVAPTPAASTQPETYRWLELAAEALALLDEAGARVVGHYERRGGVTFVRDVRGTLLGVAAAGGTMSADGTQVSRHEDPEALLPSRTVVH